MSVGVGTYTILSFFFNVRNFAMGLKTRQMTEVKKTRFLFEKSDVSFLFDFEIQIFMHALSHLLCYSAVTSMHAKALCQFCLNLLW